MSIYFIYPWVYINNEETIHGHNTLSCYNFDKLIQKVAFIRVDEDGEPERSPEFTRTYHEMNIVVYRTGGYA